MQHSIIAIVLIILGLTTCQSNQMVNHQDNFEHDSISKLWATDKFIPGGVEVQSKYARSGNKAAKFTLHHGDQIAEEIGSKYERAELKESKNLFSAENANYAYSFSLFLPPDFPIVPTRLVIAQWKQNCKSGDCDPNNPVIALRYQSGQLRVSLQVGPDKTILFTRNDSLLNTWLDFKFDIRFSRKPDGIIKAWLNDKMIIDYKGVTAYSQDFGYPFPGDFYFKVGLYRDTMVQPMVIYLDDYKKQQIPRL
jgi:hypothetical protein